MGDVVGKGLLAAIRVTAIKNMIRCYSFLLDQPSKVMSLVNDALCREIAVENDMLMAFYAVLDTNNSTLTYSNAGHEPPIAWHCDGNIEQMKQGGIMFCGMGGQVYLEGSMNLQAGDIIVVVTDGTMYACEEKRKDHLGTNRKNLSSIRLQIIPNSRPETNLYVLKTSPSVRPEGANATAFTLPVEGRCAVTTSSPVPGLSR